MSSLNGGPSLTNSGNVVPVGYDKDASALRANGLPIPVVQMSTDPIYGITSVDSTSQSALDASGLFPVVGVRNLKASNTLNLRNMLASSGYLRGIIQFIGDSYPQGRASAGDTDVGARKWAWPIQLISLLNAAGYQAQADSVCGWGSVTPSTIDGYVAYDPRVSYTGTVTKYSGIAGLGYEMFQLASGATVTFTPGSTFDTVDVFWAAGASGATGTFTVSDGVGVKATIDCSLNSGGVRTQTVTLAANTTAVTFTANGASAATISFWKVRTAGSHGIEAINCGQAGKPLNQWSPSAASAPYGTQASLNLMDGTTPTVTVLDGWYNDYKQPRTLNQALTDLRSILTWAQTKGDIWFINYANLNPAQVDAATYATWSQAVMNVVINEYNGVVVDASVMIPNCTNANAQNLMAADLLHLQKGGHALVAKSICAAMLSSFTRI